MEELYLSSDALRSLSKLTRYLILNHGLVLKMSDPLVLSKVFETCEKQTDEEIIDLFTDLKADMSKPVLDGATSFVFYANDHVLTAVQSGIQSLVVRDRRGNEKFQQFR